jgi:hypothetical protein
VLAGVALALSFFKMKRIYLFLKSTVEGRHLWLWSCYVRIEAVNITIDIILFISAILVLVGRTERHGGTFGC